MPFFNFIWPSQFVFSDQSPEFLLDRRRLREKGSRAWEVVFFFPFFFFNYRGAVN